MNGKRCGRGFEEGSLEGRGEVMSRRGKQSRRAVGAAVSAERVRGAVAKIDMDNKRGKTRRVHCDAKPRPRFGRRVVKDAYRARESWERVR